MKKLTLIVVAIATTITLAGGSASATNDKGYTPPTYPPHTPAKCMEYRFEKATSTWDKKSGWSSFVDWPGVGPLAWGVVPNPRTGNHGGTVGKHGHRVYAYVVVDKREVTTGECAPPPPTTTPPTTVPPTTEPPATTTPPTTVPPTTEPPATTEPPQTTVPPDTTAPPVTTTPDTTTPPVVDTTTPPTVPPSVSPTTIAVTVPPAPTTPPPALPATGSSSVLLMGAALAALASGTALLGFARRR